MKDWYLIHIGKWASKLLKFESIFPPPPKKMLTNHKIFSPKDVMSREWDLEPVQDSWQNVEQRDLRWGKCYYYTVHLYSVLCTLYTCPLYSVHCTLYTIHCTHCRMPISPTVAELILCRDPTGVRSVNEYLSVDSGALGGRMQRWAHKQWLESARTEQMWSDNLLMYTSQDI